MNLEKNVDQDDEHGVGQVEYQPHLHRLDVRGGGQAGGHREVDRGQDHHAGSNKISTTKQPNTFVRS